VSIRTLYRYFATREALFEEAGPRIVERLDLPTAIAGADDIVPSFLDASRALSVHPRLARSMLRSSLGRRARETGRSRRVRDVMAAVAELTVHLDSGEARRRGAVIAYLCSSASHVTISDETGMDADDARAAVAWALTTLLNVLRDDDRRTNHASATRRSGGRR
jgi:AcrR family transcriptional regulator